MNLVWSETELKFLIENAGRLKDAEVAATLSRLTGRHVTLAAVRHARLRLGIKKRHGPGVCEVRQVKKVLVCLERLKGRPPGRGKP